MNIGIAVDEKWRYEIQWLMLELMKAHQVGTKAEFKKAVETINEYASVFEDEEE